MRPEHCGVEAPAAPVMLGEADAVDDGAEGVGAADVEGAAVGVAEVGAALMVGATEAEGVLDVADAEGVLEEAAVLGRAELVEGVDVGETDDADVSAGSGVSVPKHPDRASAPARARDRSAGRRRAAGAMRMRPC